MYFWKTHQLAEDIKNETISDNEWKNYYLAGSILVVLSMYLILLSPREDIYSVLVEVAGTIGVIIFGVNITFKTNQAGNGDGANFIARLTALSLPLLIKITVLSFAVGIIIGFLSGFFSMVIEMGEWFSAVLTILLEGFLFWRINIHLRYINA